MACVNAAFSVVGVGSCVTNASLNVGVGMAVASNTKGLIGSAVCVGTTVGGGDVGEAPPSGVGVAYCPHRDALLPPHADAASRNEAAIKRLISRFTD